MLPQISVQRVSLRSVYVDFSEEREGDLIIRFAKRLNLFFTSRLLLRKLVARKAKDGEALVLVFAVQVLQPSIVWSQPAGTGGVHDQ
ncbi:hypothetical protein D3C81_1202900 [compost metagenome]